MTREEVIGPCRLILGDAREVMIGLEASAVITDPVWPNCPPDTVAGSDDPDLLWKQACQSMPDCARLIVVLRGDSDPRFLRHVPGMLEFFRLIQLSYAVPSQNGRKLLGDEYAYWFGAPIRSGRGRHLVPGRGPVAQPGSKRDNPHPFPRPQVHSDWLVQWGSDVDEVVLDPFMGSGSTMVSCAKLGRAGIGIEVDPAFFDLACRRVEESLRQSDFLSASEPEPPKRINLMGMSIDEVNDLLRTEVDPVIRSLAVENEPCEREKDSQ